MKTGKDIGLYFVEGCKKYPKDDNLAVLYSQAKFGTEMDKNFAKLISETPAKQIKIKSLDDIKTIIKDLDF